MSGTGNTAYDNSYEVLKTATVGPSTLAGGYQAAPTGTATNAQRFYLATNGTLYNGDQTLQAMVAGNNANDISLFNIYLFPNTGVANNAASANWQLLCCYTTTDAKLACAVPSNGANVFQIESGTDNTQIGTQVYQPYPANLNIVVNPT